MDQTRLSEQAYLDDVCAPQLVEPLGRDPLDAVDDAGERAGNGGRGVRVIPEIHRDERALGVARRVGQTPERRVEGVANEAGRADLAHRSRCNVARHLRRTRAGNEVPRDMHHGDAYLRRDRVRVRNRGDGAPLVVGGVGERERDRAHERAVAVVPLPRKAVPALERLARGIAHVEEPVDRVGTFAIPPHEARECRQRQCAPAHGSCRRSRAPSTCRHSTCRQAGRGCRGRPYPCSGTSCADGTHTARPARRPPPGRRRSHEVSV